MPEMKGMKFDGGKLPVHLIAHDVVISDHRPAQGIEFYAARLRAWWNKAGTLPALQLDNEDIEGLAKVLEFGAKKYAARNWEAGILYSRVFGAAMRHYAGRGGADAETGLPHAHHFLCCYMFLAAYTGRGQHEFDDRPGLAFVRLTDDIIVTKVDKGNVELAASIAEASELTERGFQGVEARRV